MGGLAGGLMIGIFIGLILHEISMFLYQNTLELKAVDKSAECIRGKFYYIVPEDELYPFEKKRSK